LESAGGRVGAPFRAEVEISEVEEFVMESPGQDSVHAYRPRRRSFREPTSEERAIHGRWARTALACYCGLFVLGGITVLANRSGVIPVQQPAPASQQNSPANGVRPTAPRGDVL
jgi:hypothetical protein